MVFSSPLTLGPVTACLEITYVMVMSSLLYKKVRLLSVLKSQQIATTFYFNACSVRNCFFSPLILWRGFLYWEILFLILFPSNLSSKLTQNPQFHTTLTFTTLFQATCSSPWNYWNSHLISLSLSVLVCLNFTVTLLQNLSFKSEMRSCCSSSPTPTSYEKLL